ncbi:hypothetical protein [Oligoflexus tunisiensis]|uniref:hypothetical protein n=1 Tax=Oligoflexus tunisiensis TaxID=708132 RepID=UPI00114CF909|nr:hypothetical protein [Oligoflexus tunisiensis]
MKIINIAAISFFLATLSVEAFAQSEPLPLNTRIKPNEVDGLTKSFDIYVENTSNTRPVYCKRAYLTAYIGRDSDSNECREDYFQRTNLNILPFELASNEPILLARELSERGTGYIDLLGGRKYLESLHPVVLDYMNPSVKFKYFLHNNFMRDPRTFDRSAYPYNSTSNLGKKDLEDFLRSTGESPDNVEFCAREQLFLDCGFNCSNGAKYGSKETSRVKNGGGEIQSLCNERGEEIPDPNTLKCDSGYLPNKSTFECEIICEDTHQRNPKTNTCEPRTCARGEIWDEPTRNGTITYVCDSGAPKFSALNCNYPQEFYTPAGTSCDRKGKSDRYRPGNPMIQTQCAKQGEGPYWTAVECRKSQAIVYGPYNDYPFGGRYRVTFHVGKISNFAPGAANTEVFTIDVYGNQRVLDQRVIKQSDLINYPLRVDSFTVLQLYGFNAGFPDTLIETKDALKPDPTSPEERKQAGRWVQIVLEFESLDEIKGLETRVWTNNAVVNVAGIDIEFMPYQ